MDPNNVTGKYILDKDDNPVSEPDLIRWGRWMKNNSRKIKRTEISKDVVVSTVFLGLDHNFSDGVPILFETLVFGGEYDGERYRYTTAEKARKDHVKMVRKIKGPHLKIVASKSA